MFEKQPLGHVWGWSPWSVIGISYTLYCQFLHLLLLQHL